MEARRNKFERERAQLTVVGLDPFPTPTPMPNLELGTKYTLMQTEAFIKHVLIQLLLFQFQSLLSLSNL